MAPDAPAPARTGRLWRVAPGLVFVIALCLATWAVVDQRHEIEVALDQIVWWALPLSYAAGLAALLCVFRAWSALVEDAGVRLSRRQGLQIYGIGQVGKYMPGGVWSVAVQAQMAREFGGSRLRMASASMVILVLGVAVSLTMGSILLPLSGPEARERFWYAPVLAVASLIALSPSVLNRSSSLVARVFRQSASTPAFTRRGVLVASSWMASGNLLFGLHLQAIGGGLGVDGFRGYLLSTAAYCLAASFGLVFVLAPAGAGVRELVITVVLAPTISTGGALVVALLSRVATIASDFTLALIQLAARASRPRRPVFVTRRFPPSVGGMETLAASVWRAIESARPDAILIAHRGSNRGLIWWLPCAWARVAMLVLSRRAEIVLVGDAPTFAILEPLMRWGRVPRGTMILGLDVTHTAPGYSRLVLAALRRAPKVIAISTATQDAALAVGVPADRISVLRLGVETPAVTLEDRRRARVLVHERLGLSESDAVLLTLGRLVRRKGSRWFVDHVMQRLPATTHYVIAGDGPERDEIRDAIDSHGLSRRVHLLGPVSEEVREELMLGCDLFVQPNISVPGDMEGFGLVTIEAGARGTPVVASDLEGLRDAIVPGVTGFLVPAQDVDAWVRKVEDLVEDLTALERIGWEFREASTERYGETAMAERLRDLVFERA